MEAGGGVKRMEQKAAADSGFAAALERAHAEYRVEREALEDGLTGPSTVGGVGGARAGVKCLHAHYAHTRAGGDNPVGDLVASWVEPLDCSTPCVIDGALNPGWSATP
jgi:hypothetical protein